MIQAAGRSVDSPPDGVGSWRNVSWRRARLLRVPDSPPHRFCLQPRTASLKRRGARPNYPLVTSDADVKTSMQWLGSMLVRNMPPTYEGEKDWGRVKQIWSGVKIHREGFELKTNRRFREVNHGHWIRYDVSRPAAGEGATIQIDDAAKIGDVSDQASAPKGWRIQSTITSPMHFTARIERWNLGLKWYSVSISGRMRVSVRCTSPVSRDRG